MPSRRRPCHQSRLLFSPTLSTQKKMSTPHSKRPSASACWPCSANFSTHNQESIHTCNQRSTRCHRVSVIFIQGEGKHRPSPQPTLILAQCPRGGAMLAFALSPIVLSPSTRLSSPP